MAELDHWHPVLLAKDLGSKPKVVTLLGQDLVLYRPIAPDGTRGVRSRGARSACPQPIAALSNTCPHRRMQLADGHVEGECLVCPYHGFRFAPDGTGHSPGTPQMRLAAPAFDVQVAHEAIWVRRAGSTADFPELGRGHYTFVGTLARKVECALEPLVDNFCEVEHTPTTHALFGYAPGSMDRVRTATHAVPRGLRVVNEGPQKKLPGLVERLFGVATGDRFIDDWTVRYSPVHIAYDQWWIDAKTGEPRPDRIYVAVFFTPIDQDETQLFAMVWSSRQRWGRFGLDALLRPMLLELVWREMELDRKMVERLADQRGDLRGTRLGRFDAALREYRKGVAAIYRGREPD